MFCVYLESIKSDCLSAKERFRNISSEPIESIDIFGQYDAMVVHGDAREDELFAADLIGRLEALNLKGKILQLLNLLLIFKIRLNSSQFMIYN